MSTLPHPASSAATPGSASTLISVNSGWRILSLPHPEVALLQQGGDYRLFNLRGAECQLIPRRLKQQLQHGLISQPLLMPVTLNLEPELRDLFEQKGDWLSRIGMEWRPAHGGSVMILRVPAALRQTNLVETLASLLRLLAELEPCAVEAQIERLGDWLAGKAASRLDGGLTAALQLLAEIEGEWPELLCQAEITRPVPLAGLIEELLHHE